MLINIALFILLSGTTKWKARPYAGSLLIGLIKGALYFFVPLRNHPFGICLVNGIIGLVLFGGDAAAIVYLFRRLDKAPTKKIPTYKTLGGDKMEIKWEYFPLSIFVILFVFGEMIFM
jgi:hypothetical protein